MRHITTLLVFLTVSILLPCALCAQEENKGLPFQIVEQKPTFNGGEAINFSKWVNSNLVYPETAREAGLQGRVTLQFTIKADGTIADVRVLRGVSPDLDREAVRVVSSAPKWEPGMDGGKPVDVIYTFPVIFKYNAQPAPAPAAAITESIPFQMIQKKPSFGGGDSNEFSKWVNSHLVYPETAKSNGIQGRVTLQFTIKADGTIADVRVLRGVSPDLDREAVRVVSASPKWEPGMQDGAPVDVIYTFPVIFSLR